MSISLHSYWPHRALRLPISFQLKQFEQKRRKKQKQKKNISRKTGKKSSTCIPTSSYPSMLPSPLLFYHIFYSVTLHPPFRNFAYFFFLLPSSSISICCLRKILLIITIIKRGLIQIKKDVRFSFLIDSQE